jgi:hypothetical protein
MLRLYPSLADIYYTGGVAYHGKKDYDRAIAACTEMSVRRKSAVTVRFCSCPPQTLFVFHVGEKMFYQEELL